MSLDNENLTISRSSPANATSASGLIFSFSNWGRTLASEKPRIFALIIGAIGSVMGIMFFVYANSNDENLKSNWYWIMVLFLILFLLIMIYGFLPIILGITISSSIRNAVADNKILKFNKACRRLQKENSD